MNELEKEIRLNYKGEKIKTIYIGGGTPSVLSKEELKRLFEILKVFNKDKNVEFSIECNPEDLIKEKTDLFFEYGINRVSIGVQTFEKKYLNLLNRKHKLSDVVAAIANLKESNISNINIDIMYGFSGQSIEEFLEDLKKCIDLGVKHISMYSLILEENTRLYIDKYLEIEEDIESEMYFKGIELLKDSGFKHYELSNFHKDDYYCRHNLVYWNNENYYGFGLAASGYTNNIRYTNTRSINNYLRGKHKLDNEFLTTKEKINYHIILGLRKIKGINKKEFQNLYDISIKEIKNVDKLLKEGKLKENDEYIYINYEYLYLSNMILVEII